MLWAQVWFDGFLDHFLADGHPGLVVEEWRICVWSQYVGEMQGYKGGVAEKNGVVPMTPISQITSKQYDMNDQDHLNK